MRQGSPSAKNSLVSAPDDIQTQLDLVFSYRRLGSAQRRIGDFTAAKAALSAALELTNQLLATGQTNPRIIAEKASVAEELAVCEQSLVAGDWDVLLDDLLSDCHSCWPCVARCSPRRGGSPKFGKRRENSPR